MTAPQEWLRRRAPTTSPSSSPTNGATHAAQRRSPMRTRYMTRAGREHVPSAERRGADAPLRGVRRAGAAHGRRRSARSSPNVPIVRGHGQVGRRAPPRLDGRSRSPHSRAEGYRIVATTPHREDAARPKRSTSRAGPFALVFGTEHAGISDEAMAAADEFLRIPMCGHGREPQRLGLGGDPRSTCSRSACARRSRGWRLPPLEAAALRLPLDAGRRDATPKGFWRGAFPKS